MWVLALGKSSHTEIFIIFLITAPTKLQTSQVTSAN